MQTKTSCSETFVLNNAIGRNTLDAVIQLLWVTTGATEALVVQRSQFDYIGNFWIFSAVISDHSNYFSEWRSTRDIQWIIPPLFLVDVYTKSFELFVYILLMAYSLDICLFLLG